MLIDEQEAYDDDDDDDDDDDNDDSILFDIAIARTDMLSQINEPLHTRNSHIHNTTYVQSTTARHTHTTTYIIELHTTSHRHAQRAISVYYQCFNIKIIQS
jgi:hypothetical protein